MIREVEGVSIPESPSEAACAQAAAWIARLHGPERSAKVERGFRLWLAEDRSHQTAFDMANEIWNETEHWPKSGISTFVRRETVGNRITRSRWLAVAAGLAVVAVAGSSLYLRIRGIATQVGEQRALTLADSSRVLLNTNTRIVVHMNRHDRTVELKNGEALFEVAKDPARRFIVIAGDRRVEALGTQFVVRRDVDDTNVTLIEGKVAVSSINRHPNPSPSKGEGDSKSRMRNQIVLSPGERLVLAEKKPPIIDRPSIEKLTAWQRNQVILDHTLLSEAVKEMNRYSSTPLVLANREAEAVQITGVFRAGDSGSFAQAVADAYRFQVTKKSNEILISGTPVPVHR